MTLEIFLLLVILAATLALFAFEWVPADVTALGMLLLLVVFGLLPADRAFAGFGSDTVMMLLGLLVITAALVRTGVVERSGRALLRWAGGDMRRLHAAIMLAAAGLSAFMSNTAATAFFLPVVVDLARRARVSPSKLLMPLAFAAVLASGVTLIATSTNVVVSGLLMQHRLAPLGMFELAPVGLPVALVGLAYMLTVGRRLIPERAQPEALTEEFGLRPYLTELVIQPDSPLVGQRLADSGLGRDFDLTVLGVIRGDGRHLAPRAATRLEARDALLVEGQKEEILRIKDRTGIEVLADAAVSDRDLQSDDMQLAEVILLPGSPLIWRTLRGYGFREQHGLQVLAINRHGETLRRRLSQTRLRMGDVLLLQGSRDDIAALQSNRTFHVLGTLEAGGPNPRRAILAAGIFVGALALATANVLSLPVAFLAGAVLAFLTRCITPEEAYRQVEWKVLILIGSMLGLGAAMEHTGAARFLAAQIVSRVGAAHPAWLLSAFFGLTVLLTQPLSNQAAAVVVLPIALQAAAQLGWNPRAFAAMIAIAASCSFITPLEPACLMVYGPGRYRFVDFVKVGAPLTVLIYAIAIALVPLVWPPFR